MIIGIAGKMGAGKDYLAEKFDVHELYHILHFADGVYDIARNIFGMVVKNRELLQQIGTKMREIDPRVWIKNTMEQAKRFKDVVIADVRYESEIKAILDAGGKVIVLDVDDDLRKYRVEKRDGMRIHPYDWNKINNHSSETYIDKLIIDAQSKIVSKHIMVISGVIDIVDIYYMAYNFVTNQ